MGREAGRDKDHPEVVDQEEEVSEPSLAVQRLEEMVRADTEEGPDDGEETVERLNEMLQADGADPKADGQ